MSPPVTGTQVSYYFLCHTKLWLFAHGITMEHESDLVSEGRLIHESSYPRRSEKYEEVSIGGIKIDYYDAKRKVIHEVKKSDKMEPAHEWQLKYYILVLEQHGVQGVSGILEYPKLKRTTGVLLCDRDRNELESITENIRKIIAAEACPARIRKTLCRNCSYHDFCFTSEPIEIK